MHDAGTIVSAPRDGQDTVALWASFAGATDLTTLCRAWLALQCRTLQARAGVVLWRQADGGFVPVAVWPHPAHDVTHLGSVARQALSERRGLLIKAPADPVNRTTGERAFLAYPVGTPETVSGVAVVDVRVASEAQLQQAMQALHWGAGWLQSRADHARAEELHRALQRLSTAHDLAAALAEQDDAPSAMLALVNALAERTGATRVLLGTARRGRVKLQAISNTASFDARTQAVGAVENLMEEALDQMATVAAPPHRPEALAVNVAHDEYRRDAALGAVASVVIPGREDAVGVITVESADAALLDARTIELVEATAVLVGPALQDKLALRRWLAGRGTDAVREGWRRLTGRGFGTFKLGALLLVLAGLGLAVARQDYRVTARAVIEGAVQRAAVAPFRGYVASADVRAGATVNEGDVLAVLDDRDLQLERARWSAEVEQAGQRYRDALAKKERAASVLAAAQMREAQAQLDLVNEKLSRSRIRAPTAGLVVAGDLSQMLGSPVEAGQTLFEIAPLDAYRVVIQVDERDIDDVRVGQRGQIVLTGRADEPLDFVVRNVTAVSEQHEGRNVFRVEAELEAPPRELRPGLEGVGKVAVGERSVLWVWTHRFIDWLRISMWRWLP